MSKVSSHRLVVKIVDKRVPKEIFKDRGMRGFCPCGWQSTLSGTAEQIGAEFDEHLEEIETQGVKFTHAQTHLSP